MFRIDTTICIGVLFLIQSVAVAEPSTASGQRFIVRVEPVVRVPNRLVHKQLVPMTGDVELPTNSDTPVGRLPAAFPLDWSAPAGILIRFEVRAVTNRKKTAKTGESGTGETSFEKIGPDDDITSADGTPKEIVIISTIMSME